MCCNNHNKKNSRALNKQKYKFQKKRLLATRLKMTTSKLRAIGWTERLCCPSCCNNSKTGGVKEEKVGVKNVDRQFKHFLCGSEVCVYEKQCFYTHTLGVRVTPNTYGKARECVIHFD